MSDERARRLREWHDAARSSNVVAVDVNPAAVRCARENAELNGVGSKIEVLESDLFQNVAGTFDLIVFDPPFRWFRPRDMRERGIADENYATLTAFFQQARKHLADDGRILLSFGTSGDLAYLKHLIGQTKFQTEELRKTEIVKDGFPVAYFVYRLTP
jgi:release factor glutamine methyltransferase